MAEEESCTPVTLELNAAIAASQGREMWSKDASPSSDIALGVESEDDMSCSSNGSAKDSAYSLA
jgi:hypothetical protein